MRRVVVKSGEGWFLCVGSAAVPRPDGEPGASRFVAFKFFHVSRCVESGTSVIATPSSLSHYRTSYAIVLKPVSKSKMGANYIVHCKKLLQPMTLIMTKK
jgi:hypothetical protein